MNPKNASTNTTSKVVVYNKKKEENNASTSNPLTHVSLVKSITEETSDSLISASNNAEMSDTISYNKAQRTCHQRRCKAGQVGKDGKIQTNLHAGVSTPDDSFLYSSNNDEMLKSQYTQQELDEIEKHQEYQKQQEMLVQESTQLLKLVAPEIVTENNNEELFTKVCTKCGAIQKVPYKVDKCKFSPDHKLIVYEDESEIKTSKRYDVDSGDEITTFVNIEAEMGLGTRDPEIEQINPYIKTWHYDFRNDLVYGSMKQLYPNKARKSDIERESELINDQICNLANCLNDDSPVLRNWARKVIRLVQSDNEVRENEYIDVETPDGSYKQLHRKETTNEVSLVPNNHKQVAVNMYKKIIREFGHYIEATYPETPDHLSAKALGVHTWNFQLATKVKQDGKWIAKANVDIDVIMNILKAFSNTEINYPTIELVKNEIIMYGDSNQRMSWQDKGKRSGKDGKVVTAWNHDKMPNQAFQQYNMDYMVEQSEHLDGSKMNHGVDFIFDGDVIKFTKVAN